MKLILTTVTPSLEYPLPGSITTIGTAEDVDIHLQGSKIAEYHAVIRQEGGMFSISSLDNDAHIYVNGHPVIQGHTLWPQDEIEVGSARFVFYRDDANLEAAGPSEKKLVEDVLRNTELNAESEIELKQLETLDTETLEMLRKKSLNIKPASGLSAFLQQGWHLADGGQSKSIFGMMFTLPAISLTIYQKLRAKFGKSAEEAFPEGTWQFYTQFGLREDTARHANETEGFHQAITTLASEVDQAAAWVYQCITMLFEYETLLENEWVERTLLRLIHEAIAEVVVEQMAVVRAGLDMDPNSAEFAVIKEEIWQTEIERIEIETEQIKRNLRLTGLPEAWVKKRPYRKSPDSPHETYPQYRRRLFLAFLAEAADRLPSRMGATIWDHYYERSSTALPAYQKQMSLLYALKPEQQQDQKVAIPLWQAKIGFIFKKRYYLLWAAHHDNQGRLLAFKPSTPEDPGEPLILRYEEDGKLVDQHGRQISVDRKSNITITDQDGHNQIKVIRPTPAEAIKTQLADILHKAAPPDTSAEPIDILLAQAPRAEQPRLINLLPQATQKELIMFNHVPIIINWDPRKRQDTLQKIRNDQRGIGNHALTIFRTESSFVFDQSHIFYDAIWGMMISQIITDSAIETYYHMSTLPIEGTLQAISPLRLMGNEDFHKAIRDIIAPIEVTAETTTPKLVQINHLRQLLKQLNIPITVNDFLTFYRTLHDQFYSPGLLLQRRLMQLRLDGHEAIVDDIEAHWKAKKAEPTSLLLPMDASFVDPKQRLFPATFKNFLPDFASLYKKVVTLLDQVTYTPTAEIQKTFLEMRGQLMANLLVMVEYFKMLKQVTRQGESLSTAAIKYLAHLPPGMQGTLDLIPQHVGALNEILKGEEVFSNVGRVAPTSSLVRFMSAKDDGTSKIMVWGAMCDRHDNLKITLRDFRPHVAKLCTLDYEDIATLITQDYLEAYAHGLNQFSEDLARITITQIE